MPTRRITTAVLTAFLTLAFTFIGGGSAQATHAGPFLYHAGPSSLTPCVYMQVKTHTGTTLDVACYGEWSLRGVMSAWVPDNGATSYRLRIQSIATGGIYTSGCGASMRIGNGDGTGNSAKVIGVYAC